MTDHLKTLQEALEIYHKIQAERTEAQKANDLYRAKRDSAKDQAPTPSPAVDKDQIPALPPPPAQQHLDTLTDMRPATNVNAMIDRQGDLNTLFAQADAVAGQ